MACQRATTLRLVVGRLARLAREAIRAACSSTRDGGQPALLRRRGGPRQLCVCRVMQVSCVEGQGINVATRAAEGGRGGIPLLLMNGLGANLEVLQPFVDALDPAIEVIRFDVPGVG